MTDGAQFDIDEDGCCYVTVGEHPTVYETYDAAVEDVQNKLDESDDAFVAELTISGNGDDVEVNFSQVEWPKIIKEMGGL